MERKTRLELATTCLEGRYSTIELLPHFIFRILTKTTYKLGMTRFERATPSSQARCATKLRHIPLKFSPIYRLAAHLRCYLSQTILNRLFGRVKLRHIPLIFHRFIDWQRTCGATFHKRHLSRLPRPIKLLLVSFSVFKELTLIDSKYLKFNNNKSNRQDSFSYLKYVYVYKQLYNFKKLARTRLKS